MNWIIVDKSKTAAPSGTRYNDPRWKAAIAEEGLYQCVYCAAHDSSMGGIRSYHIEHYKPKEKYPDLKHDFSNLFYVCPICNGFKSDDWPCDPLEDNSKSAYPDPSKVNYSTILALQDNKAVGLNIAGRYIVEKLYLNRPQLIILRRISRLFETHNYIRHKIDELRESYSVMNEAQKKILVEEIWKLESHISKLRAKISDARLYEPRDITRET